MDDGFQLRLGQGSERSCCNNGCQRGTGGNTDPMARDSTRLSG